MSFLPKPLSSFTIDLFFPVNFSLLPLLYHWNIVGHEKELSRLEQDLSNNNLSHAYLFSGPDKIGKNSIAKTFAGILQCENNFCHTCPACIQIQKGCHYDTFELLDDGETIKIERIRDLIGSLALSTQSPRKIVIMQNIERLTPEAMNALLKSLEEPPRRVIFLLTTNDVKAISDTLISRVRLYSFHLVPKNILETALKDRYPSIPFHTLALILSFALGKPGKAIELLENPELLKQCQSIYNDLDLWYRKPDIVRQFVKSEELMADPLKIKMFFEIFLHFLRHELLSLGNRGTDHWEQISRLIHLINASKRTMRLIERNINPRLALENLMLQFI